MCKTTILIFSLSPFIYLLKSSPSFVGMNLVAHVITPINWSPLASTYLEKVSQNSVGFGGQP